MIKKSAPQWISSNDSVMAAKVSVSVHSLTVSFDSSSRFYLHGLTLTPACISNHMSSKVRDEITYPFLNFNAAIIEF